MQTDETLGDHILNGFVLPPTHLVGDAMNKFAGQLTSRVATASDAFCGNIQSVNGAVSFSSFPQINLFEGADRFLEAIPLPNASIGTFPYASIENHQENTRHSAAMNGLDVVSPSLETMLHGYGGLPFPPELIGRVVGRASLPPPGQPARSCHSREWPVMEQVGFGSHSHESSQYSNELSLSLVTSRPSALHGHSTPQEQCSEMSCSNGVTSCYSLPEHTSCSSKNPSSGFKPLQLPPMLSGSRFLEAMQEILAEIACYALESNEDVGANVSFSSIGSSNGIEGDHMFVFQKQETTLEAKRKHLLALLQMVDDQYSQCLDEIHTVTSAFHAVTELEPNLHARFVLPTISFMYKSLRERISSHILAIGAHLKEGETRENKSFEACFIQKQWALQQLSKRDHQLWRPQRGLPETSVSVLRTWMFQNFLHPYPKDSEKHLLALKSGLTRNQVSNWFINARVRLWKPMIEEMCAEMNRRKARKEDEEMEGNHRNQMRFETRRFTRD
ncbi:homeobox protein ATH1-like [Salvia miltiorrhiza]|uniref:homeobox protein ATH1-like n=1 Tax=Salvia miltiorrhiza TaxID=226208 RepID=UPI0025AC0B42|nr:homeobox protein ATH1-like [Salvia miltiorrhiza]XP_057775956.1 homeobox protein ATH1-like [Salvia miltiorrhiza]